MTSPEPDPNADPGPGSGPVPSSHGRFTPPPAEPVSPSEARSNFLLAVILSGAGCLLVLLVVLALMLIGGVGVPR